MSKHDPAPPAVAREERAAPKPPPTEPARPPEAAPSAEPIEAPSEPGEAELRFATFVRFVRAKRPSLAATLVQVRALAFTETELQLGCDTDFDAERLGLKETQQALTQLLGEHAGPAVRISVIRSSGSDLPATLNERSDHAAAALRADREKRAREHPSVGKLRGLFGAEIAKVRVVDDGESR